LDDGPKAPARPLATMLGMTYRVQASGTSSSLPVAPAPAEWISSLYRLRSLWPGAAETAAHQLLMGECGRQRRQLSDPFIRIAGVEP